MLGLEGSGCPANTKNVYNWFAIFTKERTFQFASNRGFC